MDKEAPEPSGASFETPFLAERLLRMRAEKEGRNQLSFGSSASRSPSPRRLKPSTARKIAAPGATDIQGACSMKFLATLSICPQDGEGGCWPRPRKERAAS